LFLKIGCEQKRCIVVGGGGDLQALSLSLI